MLIMMKINTWWETEKSVARKIFLFSAIAISATTKVMITIRMRSLLRLRISSGGEIDKGVFLVRVIRINR